ncbi:MAG: hypothetical protein FJX02_08760 [Alphaproteobacteria bacterium]|nr:hypothetical protein [Alphaproteobacteria bacterium]
MTRRLLAPLAALALASTPANAQVAGPQVTSIGVEGTEIVVKLSDGRNLRSKELVGAVLDVRFEGQAAKMRIAAVEPDPEDKTGSVWLHTMETRGPDGQWANACSPGPDGRRQGFPIHTANGLEFTCSAGALGKCVRFGFRPWAKAPDGRDYAPIYQACVRMVRADYGGDGHGWTKDGTRIDLYDVTETQKPDNDPTDAFEAGWTEAGAVCVHHIRVKENVTLAELEQRYPRLKGRTGAVCTEEFARAHGAILFNRSPN